MVAVPAPLPVTRPVEEPTFATAILLLLHVPSDVDEVNDAGVAVHILVVPDIGAGGVFNDTNVVGDAVLLPETRQVTRSRK